MTDRYTYNGIQAIDTGRERQNSKGASEKLVYMPGDMQSIWVEATRLKPVAIPQQWGQVWLMVLIVTAVIGGLWVLQDLLQIKGRG